MSVVCFFGEDGQTATCIQQDELVPCDACEFHPFPNKIIPEDRVLRRVIND